MRSFPVIDLHCDLLSYLANDDTRTLDHPECRCSFPQLKQGNVVLQTLAISAFTRPGSSEFGKKQFSIFENHPLFSHWKGKTPLKELQVMAAIENAAALAEENEDLEVCLTRLREYQKRVGPILYASLTWNEENRFGGGAHSQVGLKEDGKKLLELLAELHIAVDFSHTSDQLAIDILNEIDQKNLPLIPIASHSNFRSVCEIARNLPDELAEEIFKRGGIIGLNLIVPFTGNSPRDFLKHVSKGIALKGKDQLCLGVDFFYPDDYEGPIPYFENFSNACCYPKLIDMLLEEFDEEVVIGLTSKNFLNYMERRQC